MYYLLMFLGIMSVAVILAMSPLVIRLRGYLFPIAEGDSPLATAANRQSIERSETRDEIRRLTAALETDRLSARKG